MNHAHNTELVDLLRMTSERLSHFTNEQVVDEFVKRQGALLVGSLHVQLTTIQSTNCSSSMLYRYVLWPPFSFHITDKTAT